MKTRASRKFNCDDQERPSWLDRAERAASLLRIVASHHRGPLAISDVGCGDMKMRSCIEDAGVQCEYRGFDIVPQTPDVVRLDLHKDRLPVPTDVVVLLGVSEYLDDLPAIVARLATEAEWFLVSHVIEESSSYTQEQLRKLGWRNHLSTEEFTRLLEDNGFVVTERDLTDNRRTMLWLCRSKHRSAAR